MYVCMHVCMHVCMYVCTYLCVYIYIYIHAYTRTLIHFGGLPGPGREAAAGGPRGDARD